MTTKSFDVFLSYNSKDKENARQIGVALRKRGLEVWFDEWELIPGLPWQEEIEKVIETVKSAVVLVGKDGLGHWEEPEMRTCLDKCVKRKLPVIPILLPGAGGEPKLPLFLERFTWVDLRNGLTDDQLNRLEWGIIGKKPEKDQHSSEERSTIINQDESSESETLEEHYKSLIKAITKGRIISFLGSDINLCDRPIQGNGELEHRFSNRKLGSA